MKKQIQKEKTSSSGRRGADPSLRKTIKRAQLLVDRFLCAMEKGLEEEGLSETWVRNFGNKDSAVSNLQKLVAVIGHLSVAHEKKEQVEAEPPANRISREELELLRKWLEDGEN